MAGNPQRPFKFGLKQLLDAIVVIYDSVFLSGTGQGISTIVGELLTEPRIDSDSLAGQNRILERTIHHEGAESVLHRS